MKIIKTRATPSPRRAPSSARSQWQSRWCSDCCAGSTDHLPPSAIIFIEGMSSDHTDAATITSEAKPSNDF
ncbi:MAG: hypothetical protein IJ892_11445 [Prevotella sp.]|nr:hypothetical protein [Prevotella sp.]